MMKDKIDLTKLSSIGKAEIKIENEITKITTTQSIAPLSFNLHEDRFKKHCVSLPEKYRLPLRIDMTVKLDFPAFILLVGSGHITFATPWQVNRKIEDIFSPSGKPNQDKNSYDNSIPFNEFADISVIYDFKEMQILINGEERFYSRRQPYMKAENIGELEIRLAVSKRSVLEIKNIAVTQYDENAPVTRGTFTEKKPQPPDKSIKHTFESIVSTLPQEFSDEIIETDKFLKSLRSLKFKRVIEKNGTKITYIASDYGISYTIRASGAESSHDFGWYIITAGKPETWHRKADYMVQILAEIAKTDQPLAERIFNSISDCAFCAPQNNICMTPYSFNGKKRVACHGRVTLRMCRDDFNDAREFFKHLNLFAESM
jgi:hypothetical protein